jgi:hypothetical protein
MSLKILFLHSHQDIFLEKCGALSNEHGKHFHCDMSTDSFGGLGVSVLAFGIQVRGFKPGRSRWIFKGEKILIMPSFGGEVKSVPCHSFAACKRSLELRGSRILGQNLLEHFSPTKSSTFRYVDMKAPSGEGGNV